MSDDKANDPGQSVWDEARDLVKRLEGTSVRRLCVKSSDFTIEIERRVRGAAGAAGAAAAEAAMPMTADGAADADSRHPILAPLVGTFYRAPEPGSKPFVEEGDVVDEGQTIAIVEAMKLMNQVKADRPGRVAEITATDGDWVEFEQVLMRLEPLEA
jgi:acetyl-CoA carboxylase biotin carboxyl carrier protein